MYRFGLGGLGLEVSNTKQKKGSSIPDRFWDFPIFHWIFFHSGWFPYWRTPSIPLVGITTEVIIDSSSFSWEVDQMQHAFRSLSWGYLEPNKMHGFSKNSSEGPPFSVETGWKVTPNCRGWPHGPTPFLLVSVAARAVCPSRNNLVELSAMKVWPQSCSLQLWGGWWFYDKLCSFITQLMAENERICTSNFSNRGAKTITRRGHHVSLLHSVPWLTQLRWCLSQWWSRCRRVMDGGSGPLDGKGHGNRCHPDESPSGFTWIHLCLVRFGRLSGQFSPIFTNFHQFSSMFIHFHQFSLMFINFHQCSSIFINFHQFSCLGKGLQYHARHLFFVFGISCGKLEADHGRSGKWQRSQLYRRHAQSECLADELTENRPFSAAKI